MKWLKRVGIVGATLVALFFVVGYFLPKSYVVSRSILVEADSEQVHTLVGDLARWPEWTPWAELDPSIRTTVGSRSRGVGASQSWSGESGSGELTFTRSDPESGVVYDFSVNEGRYEAVGAIRYSAEAGGTQVSWEMSGGAGGILGRYLSLMMDDLLGPSFEKGLNKLKSLVEELPDEPPPGDAEGSAT